MYENITIFEPCTMEYPTEDKPVMYTDDFLKDLAKKTVKSNLVGEKHLSNSIGSVSNLSFINGKLMANIDTGKSIDGLKYSPYFECSLVDKGEYYEAIDGKLIEVALTSNPRQKLPNTGGGSSMSDGNTDNETIKILNGQIKDLNKELAVEQNKNKANKEKLSKFEEMEKELTELREWKETNSKILEEQKPIIEQFKKQEAEKHEELLNQLTGENTELKEKFKDFTTEQLETLLDTQVESQPAKGVDTKTAPGLNQGSGETNEEKEAEARLNAVQNMFSDLKIKEGE